MKRIQITAAACGIAGLLGLFAAGCGSSEEVPEGATVLRFELTDEGCLPHQASAKAGPVAFEAENTGSSKVTEIEIMDGDRVLGEKEDLSEGLGASFSLTLEAGNYTVYCPGGDHEKGLLRVTGAKHLAGATKGEADGDEAETAAP